MNSIAGKTIFISYSHKDAKWLERFQAHLKGWLLDADVLAWSDKQLQAGDRWRDEIEHAIAASSAAVLLLTQNFLASEFIMKEELPMLQQAQARGLRLLWMHVSPANLEAKALSELHSLHEEPERAIATRSEPEQDQAFREVCHNIRDILSSVSKPPPGPGGDSDGNDLSRMKPLQTFRVKPLGPGPCAFDERGRLWIQDGPQIKVFHLSRPEFCDREALPDRRWKNHLDGVWRGHVVMSDWSGSLHRFDADGRTHDRPIYDARPDDLPMHLIAFHPQGGLVTAAWNGRIRFFDADGTLRNEPTLQVSALPTQLIPFADGTLVVADQQRRLHGYSPDFEEAWCWTADEEIRHVWPCEEIPEPSLMVQVGADRLVKVSGGRTVNSVSFDQPICGLSQRGSDGDRWAVVATEGGRLKWLSAASFAVVQDLPLSFSAGQVVAVEDLQNRSRLVAVGLTDQGQLFSAIESEITLFPLPGDIQRLLVDPSGRFLYLLFEDHIEVCRNPAQTRVELQVELVEPVKGTLTVNRYERVDIELRNTGPIAIHQLSASLLAPSIIEMADMIAQLTNCVEPNETVTLSFSVRAMQAGYVKLKLKLELADEGGPPTSQVELPFHIESRQE